MGQRAAPRIQPGYRYARLADDIENKITGGVYKAGEKLPSIRKLHTQTGFSITTVYQAYIELEKRGMVEPRLKSGFYVKPLLKNILPAPKLKRHRSAPKKVTIQNLIGEIVNAMSDPDITGFGGSIPSAELMPCKELTQIIRSKNSRDMKSLLMTYEKANGSLMLRQEIAKRMFGVSDGVIVDEMIITNGCMEAINICLRAAAEPGDAVIVESPTFHCFLELIEDLNMLALEIPTDPEYGIDIRSLSEALEKNDVKACILNANFQNPLGFAMPSERKKEVVELLNKKNIPIIEDNIYGDLFFGKKKPSLLKAYDKKGLVMHCSSFSKVLSPGLRVGWTLPGRFKEKVQRIKVNTSISSPRLNQDVIAEFLKTGGFDRHLRSLRSSIKNQMSNMARAIARYFPEGTKITAPEGGLILWVQLDEKMDSMAVYRKAIENRISILPGAACSTTGRYNNCIRISCGNPWDDAIEDAIARLGEIVRM